MNYTEIADKVNEPTINNVVCNILIKVEQKAKLGFYDLRYEPDNIIEHLMYKIADRLRNPPHGLSVSVNPGYQHMKTYFIIKWG